MKKIYILHGWTYSLDKWKNFSSLLKKQGFEPVFLKLPGLTSKSDAVWDLDKYSKWLNEQIIGNKGKILLIGHSNGGRIASYFAATYPEKIQRLILIDTAGIYHNELSLQIKRFLFGSAAKIGKKLTKSESLRKFFYNLVREKDYKEASPTLRKTMINLINHDSTPEFEKIKVPTLIIWGAEDKITPLSDSKVISKLISNSKLEIITGGRHSPFYTHPKEVVRIIKEYIK